MTPEQSTKLGRLQSVAAALKQAAKAAWDTGKIKDARDLYHRADIAESRAFEYELAVRYPGAWDPNVSVEELFKAGRPLL